MILPTLRMDQQAIAIDPAKVKVLSMGRRWGKSVLGRAICLHVLKRHGRVAWVAPTYKNSRTLWRAAKTACHKDARKRQVRISESERMIETQRGGLLALYSGDNIDAIRGESFHVVVLDEAARLSDEAWMDAVQPTLADHDGDAILISTPAGKNWFWLEWLKGQSRDEGYASWQGATSENPNPNIRRAAERVRDVVPETTYRQEWLGEFVDEGLVFRRIVENATATAQDQAQPGHRYVIGLDWANKEDYTVLTVIDVTSKELVHLDRYNKIGYPMQLDRVRVAYERFRPWAIIPEENSVGEPLCQQLLTEGLPVRPFVTSNPSKEEVIRKLQVALEKNELKILKDRVLISELMAYTVERSKSGRLIYGAPAGFHDDCVMSLAMAWDGAHSSGTIRVRERNSL